MNTKIDSFTMNKINRHPTMLAAKRLSERMIKFYPKISYSLIQHAALVCLSNRELGDIGRENWTDAAGADCLLGVPLWSNMADFADLREELLMPVGILKRVADWTETDIPICLPYIDEELLDYDNFVVHHTTTSKLEELDNNIFDLLLNITDAGSQDIERLEDFPHENGKERLNAIAMGAIIMSRSESRMQSIMGYIGTQLEVVTNPMFQDLIEIMDKEHSGSDKPLIDEMFEEFHESELKDMNKEQFVEALESFVQPSEPIAEDLFMLRSTARSILDGRK
jgi:hypothetical protein